MKAFYQLLYQHDTLYKEAAKAVTKGETPLPKAEAVTPPSPKPAVATVPVPPKPTATVPTVQHQVLVLIDEPGGLSPSDAIFLRKVLEAVKVNPDQVDVLNVADTKLMDFRPVLASKKVHHLISFGVPFIQVNLEIFMNRYDPKKLGGVNFLLAETLPVIQSDEKNKRALWGALKAIFFG
ncbi:MAG: hypothetical protein MUE30_18045 [Spirosomaceae bacterium]|jgi:hypothetical protein|nr:hypothetical protein [Spirosomataceae bacterium]